MATVADVIRAARDSDPGFDDQHTPDGVLVRFLTRLQQRVLARVFRVRADVVHTDETIQFPLGDFDAGEAITTSFLYVHGCTAYYENDDADPVDVELVGYHERLSEGLWPAAYIRESQFFPLGHEDDWDDIDYVILDLFPQGATLTALVDTLDLPGQPLDMAAAAASAFMARRGTSTAGWQELAAYAAQAEQEYIDQVTGLGKAEVYVPPTVW